MKSTQLLVVLIATLMASFSYKQADKSRRFSSTEVTTTPATDLNALKAEIQAIEMGETASNSKCCSHPRLYADDAVSFSNNQPMLVGKKRSKDIEAGLAKHKEGNTVELWKPWMYTVIRTLLPETEDNRYRRQWQSNIHRKVHGCMAKQDGKWKTIRDIYNDDAKEK